MAFTKLGKVADIREGAGNMYDLGNRWIGIFKVEGELLAIDDVCSHAEAYLHEGVLEGCVIECDAHGARFDIRTGKVEQGPAYTPIDTYEVRIVGDDFEVDL
jgi:3-phenylpropionate/trans-cinnamate dioxygenase ferredoxin subunit